MGKSIHYRKEIDGLRAIAVIPVVLFHAGFEWFSGGFVGVDVFFVISGFLITSIILKELDQANFSITNFYERRARRILPALFLLMLVCLPFAWFLLLPHELVDFGKSLVAVSTFSSNFLFWQESNYFSADSELMPLLHTWSLAVEEQFYVVFPLLLLLLWRFGKSTILVLIIIIAFVSFALSEWGLRAHQEANFYLLPTRAWELMIGSLTAFYLFRNKVEVSFLLSQILSSLGLVMIFVAIFFLDKNDPFPGIYALLPTIGSALIILFASKGTITNRLLSKQWMVLIGLISYSAYLWHQPILAFARIIIQDDIKPVLLFALCVIPFLLAYLSWRWVEKPFRDRNRFSRMQVFAMSFFASLLFIVIGLVFTVNQGFESRYL